MHGPEAASIMRNELNYTGTIIGIAALVRYHHFITSISMFSAITGNALPVDMAKFVAGGANEVLTKPLTKMKLMATLSRYIT